MSYSMDMKFCNIYIYIFWCRYEDDPIIGHRLYREIRKVEVKKAKAKGSQVLPNATYQWETVATNFDEFQDVSVSYLDDLLCTPSIFEFPCIPFFFLFLFIHQN